MRRGPACAGCLTVRQHTLSSQTRTKKKEARLKRLVVSGTPHCQSRGCGVRRPRRRPPATVCHSAAVLWADLGRSPARARCTRITAVLPGRQGFTAGARCWRRATDDGPPPPRLARTRIIRAHDVQFPRAIIFVGLCGRLSVDTACAIGTEGGALRRCGSLLFCCRGEGICGGRRREHLGRPGDSARCAYSATAAERQHQGRRRRSRIGGRYGKNKPGGDDLRMPFARGERMEMGSGSVFQGQPILCHCTWRPHVEGRVTTYSRAEEEKKNHELELTPLSNAVLF